MVRGFSEGKSSRLEIGKVYGYSLEGSIRSEFESLPLTLSSGFATDLETGMKRLRDDVHDDPPFKRPPFGSSYCESQSQVLGSGLDRRDSGNGADGASASKPNLTIDDAFSYLKQVKDIFSDQREKYNKFLHIMINFKNRRIDTFDVISRVKELFKGHPSLLIGLNPFLSKGYEILIINDEDEKKTNYFEEAFSFVSKIKERLGYDHKYKSFLDIMCLHRKECNDIKELYHKVVVLLNDHPDLLEEFTRFFPDNSVTANPLSNLDNDKTLMK